MELGTIIRFVCDIHVGHEGTIPKGATGIYRGVSPDSEGYHLFEMGQDHGFLEVAYGYRNCFLGDGFRSDEDGDIRVAGVKALPSLRDDIDTAGDWLVSQIIMRARDFVDNNSSLFSSDLTPDQKRLKVERAMMIGANLVHQTINQSS